MIQATRQTLLAVTLAVLGGCTVNPADCDPTNRDASIVAKARCSGSGAYDVRVQHKEKILLDEQKMNTLFRDVYTTVEKAKPEVSAELKGKRSEYKALNQSLGALLTQLQRKAGGNKLIEGQIAALKQELVNITTSDDPVVMRKQVQLD